MADDDAVEITDLRSMWHVIGRAADADLAAQDIHQTDSGGPLDDSEYEVGFDTPAGRVNLVLTYDDRRGLPI